MSDRILAWHGNPDLKAEVVERMRRHRADDEIVQGLYQKIDPELASGYKGCLIGCTLPAQKAYRTGDAFEPEPGWHGEVERLYGIPRAVGRLLDAFFEGLPVGEHAEFAVRSIEVIEPGADLSLVTSRVMLDLLADDEQGVLRHTAEGSVQRTAVEAVIGLYRRRLAGDEPTRAEWSAARRAAYAADAADAADDAAADAAYAADAAADAAAAAYAAAYAADAADAADAAAAGAAAWAAAGAAAWTAAHRRWRADRLLIHLAEAPIPAVSA